MFHFIPSGSSTPEHQRRGLAAFTLIELLVVITIIGVLAGIALPLITSVQQTGRATQCVSNLRQLGSAALLYAGEHNQSVPDDGSGTNLFPQLIWPYIYPNKPFVGYVGFPEPPEFIGTVFHCPEVNQDPSNAPMTITALRSYGMNYYMGDGDTTTPERLTNVPHPTKTMMFCDNYNSTYAYSFTIAGRHMGRSNVVYCDGHAERIVLTPAMKTSYSDPIWGDLKVNPNQ